MYEMGSGALHLPSDINPTKIKKSARSFRVLMILDHPFPPDTRVENEMRSLSRAGIEVFLLVLAPDRRAVAEKMEGGGRIIRCHVPRKMSNWMRGLSGTLPILSLFIAYRVLQLHKQYSFDAIHAHDLYTCGGALRAGKRAGIPVVGDLHEIWVSVLGLYAWSTRFPGKLFISIRQWKRLEKKWANQLDKIVVITEDMRKRYTSLVDSKVEIFALPNTINTKAFDQYLIDDEILQSHSSEFTLVHTGTINPQRGLSFLLKAMPLVLQQCNARLVIVGDGRIRPELEALARDINISGYVYFEGWQDQPKIKSYILASDVCLMPMVKSQQTEKAAPHKLFHYMYLKRPLIVTDCDYSQRVVESMDCGLVVPYGDVKALASSIIDLYRDPESCKRMGENGHRAVVEHYNWEKSAQSLIEMYKEMKK